MTDCRDRRGLCLLLPLKRCVKRQFRSSFALFVAAAAAAGSPSQSVARAARSGDDDDETRRDSCVFSARPAAGHRAPMHDARLHRQGTREQQSHVASKPLRMPDRLPAETQPKGRQGTVALRSTSPAGYSMPSRAGGAAGRAVKAGNGNGKGNFLKQSFLLLINE